MLKLCCLWWGGGARLQRCRIVATFLKRIVSFGAPLKVLDSFGVLLDCYSSHSVTILHDAESGRAALWRLPLTSKSGSHGQRWRSLSVTLASLSSPTRIVTPPTSPASQASPASPTCPPGGSFIHLGVLIDYHGQIDTFATCPTSPTCPTCPTGGSFFHLGVFIDYETMNDPVG